MKKEHLIVALNSNYWCVSGQLSYVLNRIEEQDITDDAKRDLRCKYYTLEGSISSDVFSLSNENDNRTAKELLSRFNTSIDLVKKLMKIHADFIGTYLA